jgi:hypothetical protein
MNKRIGLVIGGVAAAAVLVGGAATALAANPSPENSSGVITGCYTTGEVNGSHALVLQDEGTNCPKGTTAVTWNQTGPAGQAGTNGSNGTDGSSVVTSAGVPASACNLGDTDVDLATGEVYTCVAGSIASAGSGAGAGKAGPPGNVWSDAASSIMGQQGPQGPAGPGYVLTTGTGTDGPQFTQPGTYYIDAEAGIEDSSDTDVLTGSCTISGANLTLEKQATPMSSIGGSFVLGPGEGENFSFSGIVTVNTFQLGTSAVTPTITCQDTNQAAVTPDSVTWWVSPVSTGS